MMQLLRSRTSEGVASVSAVVLLGLTAVYLTLAQPARNTVQGVVVAKETGRPIPGAKVLLLRPRTHPSRGEWWDSEYFEDVAKARTDSSGRFRLTDVPNGIFTLTVQGEARELRQSQLRVKEGAPTDLRLELPPISQVLRLIAHQHMFIPGEKVEFAARGYVTANRLTLECYRVRPGQPKVWQAGGLQSLLGMQRYRTDPAMLDLSNRPGLMALPPQDLDITARDAEGLFYQRLHPAVSEPGLYVIRVRAGKLAELEWFVITRLGLVVKEGGGKALVFATDLQTGEPVEGCRLSLLDGDKVQATAVTSPQGLATFSLPAEHRDEVRIDGEWQGSYASATFYFYSEDSGEYRVYTYTDRPVYRPGDHVFFKSVVRQQEGDSYQVPADLPVRIQVFDDRHALIYETTGRTNQFGSVWGELDLAREAGVGAYDITLTVDDRPHTQSFEVAAYRKPEYRVSVTADRPTYVRGEPMQVNVEARHYFGAPVADASVEWAVYKAPCWYDVSEEDEYEGVPMEAGEGYFNEYGTLVAEGKTLTDATGRATVLIETREKQKRAAKGAAPSRWEAELEQGDHWWTVEVTVTDPGRHQVDGKCKVRVTRGQFSLAVTPTQSIASPGTETPVTVTATDYSKHPVPGLPVEVQFLHCSWDRKGEYRELVTRQQVVTDAQGRVTLTVKPERTGEHTIQAMARDQAGNTVEGRNYLWATDQSVTAYEYRYPDLELIPDKKSYREGETARVLVNTKVDNQTALVTIESDRILEHHLRRLTGKSTLLEVPVRSSYVPAVYVSVTYVRDKKLVTRSRRLLVSTERRELKVEVTPDRSTYAPGAQVSCQVRTTDMTGQPVPAEVSVGVVNEAVYAVVPEDGPDILGFFYPWCQYGVETVFSFPEIYLSPGEKGSRPREVREQFRDTAFWLPAITTDAQGMASVSFKLPDDVTTWRATACAHTPQTIVGTGRSTFVAKKDLMVRLAVPQFFTQNDRCKIAAIVHNESDQPQSATVSLEGAGLSPVSSPPVMIPPHGRYTFEHEVTAADPLSATLMAWARTESGLQDAVRRKLEVVPHGAREVQCRSGSGEGATEVLTLSPDALTGVGGLTIRLSPSVAAAMLGALEYLAQYPYGCTEQTLSCFLPDVAVARTLKDLGIENRGLTRKLPDMVLNGLTRLYRFQHDDGGWGWWEEDSSQVWMSAYALWGLLQAQRGGFPVRSEALRNGTQYLAGAMANAEQKITADELAFAAYTLACAGRRAAAQQAIIRSRKLLGGGPDPYVLALCALALHEMKQPREARAAVDELWQLAVDRTQPTVYWPASTASVYPRPASETTGVALMATALIQPTHPDLHRVVRWLMGVRQRNHWESTLDTAAAIYGVTAYLKATRELSPDYTATVLVNGQQVQRLRMGPESATRPETVIRVPVDKLVRGENKVAVEKQGRGMLYYSIELEQVRAGAGPLPADPGTAGVTISRDYYRLSPRKDQRTGEVSYERGDQPVTRVRYGDTIRCVLWLNATRELPYAIVEDPLPAGCEILERREQFPFWDYDWVSDVDYRDERVCLFSQALPAGKTKFVYDLRAAIPGEYRIMPTSVSSMYLPSIRSTGAENALSIVHK